MGAQAIGAGLGAIGSLYGGIQANKAGQEEARNQAADTLRMQRAKMEEVEGMAGKQASEFLNSGVLLEGSPLLAIEDTVQKGGEDAALIRQQGFRKANQYRRAGRNALIGSVFQAGAQIGQGMS